MKTLLTFTALSVFALLATAESRYKLEDKSRFQHNFQVDKKLELDNLNGFVEVLSDGGKTIRIEGERTIRAKDQSALDAAKKDVTVDYSETGGTARAYVNGPFRRKQDRSWDNYEVSYNFTVHVPASLDVELHNVNGRVTLKEIRGKFDIHVVNGRLEATGLRGAGTFRGVNGPASIEFLENPVAATAIRTVNGKLELTLPAKASAQLKFKTVNGQVYTDFEGTPGVMGGRSKAPKVFRIGAGSVPVDLETVNGSIQIRKGK
jgi:DUF4097 and DUF4098 domain-containing protein YvlB